MTEENRLNDKTFETREEAVWYVEALYPRKNGNGFYEIPWDDEKLGRGSVEIEVAQVKNADGKSVWVALTRPAVCLRHVIAHRDDLMRIDAAASAVKTTSTPEVGQALLRSTERSRESRDAVRACPTCSAVFRTLYGENP